MRSLIVCAISGTSMDRKEYSKQWRERNKEHKRLKDKEYYEKNKVRLIPRMTAYTRGWRKRNPEKYKAQYLRRRERALVNAKCRILFKNKRITLKENPRTGICKSCGQTKPRTEMHHIQYHDNDPLKDTFEMCTKCHRKTFAPKGKGRRW